MWVWGSGKAKMEVEVVKIHCIHGWNCQRITKHAPKSLLLASQMFQLLEVSPLPSLPDALPLLLFFHPPSTAHSPESWRYTTGSNSDCFPCPLMFQCCFLQEQGSVLSNHSGWQMNAENPGAILTFEMRATVNFPWPSRLHPLQPLCCG